MTTETERAKQISRIENLLRLARDREGTPEGDTAQSMADMLMRRHGLRVVLEDRKESFARELCLSVDDRPVAWKEWLGWTLAVAYRCEHVPRWTGLCWQQWVSSSELRRPAACLAHYTHISAQIENRADRLRQSLRVPDPEVYVRSYADGLACGCAVALLSLLEWNGPPPFVEDAFDHAAYLASSLDPLSFLVLGNQEPGLTPYIHRASADPAVEDSLADPPKIPPVTPNMFWMRKGQQDARYILLTSASTPKAFDRDRKDLSWQ